MCPTKYSLNKILHFIWTNHHNDGIGLEDHSVRNISTSQELQKWAKQKNLEDDPLVQLRDLELTLHEVRQKFESRKCNICNKIFTAKKNLLRHQRTAHAESSHQCGICNSKFGRINILHKHEKTHEKESIENSNK